MIKKLISGLLTITVVLTVASAVHSAASNPADTYTQSTASDTQFGTTDSDNLKAGCSNGNATSIIYLQWNLTGISQPIGPDTKLMLNVSQVVPGSSGSIKLWKVSDDTWNEATLTWSNRPANGAEIASSSIPVGTGLLTFTGQALADYTNEETSFTDGSVDTNTGDDTVSFAIGIEACSPFANIQFDSKEKSGGPAPALNLFNPTAITLSTLTANTGSTTPYPLLAALIGLTAAALVWIRRR